MFTTIFYETDIMQNTTTQASCAAFVMESILETNGMRDVNLSMTHYLDKTNKQTNKQNILEQFFIACALLESYRKRRSFCNGKHP